MLTSVSEPSKSAAVSDFLKETLNQGVRHIEQTNFFNAVKEGELTYQQLRYFLHNLAYCCQYTPLCMDAAVKNTNDPHLLAFFKEKKVEEDGHDEWVFDDLNALGASERSVDQRYVDGQIKALMTYLLNLIANRPADYLIYVLIAEYVFPAYGKTLVGYFDSYAQTQVPSLTSILKHITLDAEHVLEDFSIIDSFFSEKDLPRLKKIINEVMQFIYKFYDGFAARADEQVQELRGKVVDNITAVFSGALETSTFDKKLKLAREGSVAYLSGYATPIFNTIFVEGYKSDDASNVLSQISTFKDSNLPFMCWYLDDKLLPSFLHDEFAKNGLTYVGNFKGIALKLTQPFSVNSACNIAEAFNDDTFDQYMVVMAQVFSFSEADKSAMSEVLRKESRPETSYKHYVAYEGQVPVAVLTACVNNGVLGVYNMATLPAFRKKGFAEALVKQAVNDAIQEKASTAVAQLSPGNMASHIFRKLGFDEVAIFSGYIG